MNASIGFGVGCLPKGIRAFTARPDVLGLAESVTFLRQVDAINLRRREHVIDLAVEMLGLTFKPDSDDIGGSPALDVAAHLHRCWAEVIATDGYGIQNSKAKRPQLDDIADVDEALHGAELALPRIGLHGTTAPVDPDWQRRAILASYASVAMGAIH